MPVELIEKAVDFRNRSKFDKMVQETVAAAKRNLDNKNTALLKFWREGSQNQTVINYLHMLPLDIMKEVNHYVR